MAQIQDIREEFREHKSKRYDIELDKIINSIPPPNAKHAILSNSFNNSWDRVISLRIPRQYPPSISPKATRPTFQMLQMQQTLQS